MTAPDLSLRVAKDWPSPPDDSVVGTPDRRPRSVRRTAHINMVWPDGFGTPTRLRGRARDLLTAADGNATVVAEATMVASIGSGRTVKSLEVSPDKPRIGELVGARGGSKFRSAIDAALPGEREDATPLYFLLDDIAGASLIAGFAWSQSRPDGWGQPGPADAAPPEPMGVRKGRIICSGLRPDGVAQNTRAAGDLTAHYLRSAGDLTSADPFAWHVIEPPAEVCMRRRRRVDVWVEGHDLVLDAHFRDSLWAVDGSELALHEYSLTGAVDRTTNRITEIHAEPRVLPWPECPGAVPHVSQLVGLQVGGFRTSVQDTLQGLECCTHLNDMLRCLAEVHTLGSLLD